MRLAQHGLTKLEAMTGDLKAIMRKFGLPSLWVSARRGRGISPYDGIRIQRAIGARSPSMAVMLTMHNFTVGFCETLAEAVPCCANMLRHVASDNLLVASAFAEGRLGAGVLDSTVYVTRDGDGFRINGSKKPCTMAGCMDIITVGVAEVGADGNKSQRALQSWPAICRVSPGTLSGRCRCWPPPITTNSVSRTSA